MKNTKMCKVILIIIATLLLFSITFDSKAVDENDLPVLSQNNNTNGLVNLQPANNTSNNNKIAPIIINTFFIINPPFYF